MTASPSDAEAPDTGAAPPLNRMGMAVFALIGVLIAAYMSLYKLGIVQTLACGTGACEVVQESPWADFLGIPVPFWGVGGYGLLLATAIAGIQPGRNGDRRVAVILFGAATVALVFSAYLSWLEATRILAWCRWCIGSALVAAVLFLLSLPEIAHLRGGRG